MIRACRTRSRCRSEKGRRAPRDSLCSFDQVPARAVSRYGFMSMVASKWSFRGVSPRGTLRPSSSDTAIGSRGKLAARPQSAVPEPFPPARITLKGLGAEYPVHLAGGRGRLRADLQGGVLMLRGTWGVAEPAAARKALLRWLMTHAATAIEARLHFLAERGGFRFRALQLRRQRTRWGSCSSRGVISLNVCAVFQPPEVLDYLLIHELAHTRHMNHSADFWETVENWCPRWQRLDRELSRGWQRVPSWVFAQR